MPPPFGLKNFGLARLAIPAAGISDQLLRAALRPAPEVVTLNTPIAVAIPPRRLIRDTSFRDLHIDRIPIRIQPSEPPAPGYDRAAATRPIADVTDPVDTALFVDAAGTSNWYLPRYRLKLSANNRYDIALTVAPEGGFRLSLGFERFAAPEVAGNAGAAELPHEFAAGLEFLSISQVPRSIALTELLLEGEVVVGASARLTLPESSALIGALRQGGVQIVVRRGIKVAALLQAAGGGRPVMQFIAHDAIKPQLLMALRSDALVSKRLATRRRFRPFDRLDGGLRPDLDPEPDTPPAPAPATPRYHDLDRVLEQPRDPEPLVLDEALHGYFYQNLPRQDAGGGALTRLSVLYNDGSIERHHSYFQDADDRTLFYYLPDAVRLARAEDEPFLPEMKVRMQSADGSIAAAKATIDYGARPFTLPGRLAAAIPVLARAIPATLGAGDAPPPVPQLQPMPGAIKLKMRVPGAAGVEMRSFDDASGDLANGFTHSLTVPLVEFRQLFAAAFARDATSLFTGEAIVAIGATGSEAVPVDIRFTETEGPLFDSAETTAADGSVSVTLRNGTESPLRIRRLPVRLLRAGSDVTGRLDGLDLARPVDIAPGESRSFQILADALLPGDGPCDAVFDFADVDILASPDLVLPVISDSNVPAEYVRAVQVMAIPAILDADHPDGAIDLIRVEFETGEPVTITRATPEIVAAVRLPLINMLLGRDTKGSYGFRQLVVRRSGAQTGDADWRRSDFGLLVVPVL